ncbi:hypothetical protein [Streptomyces sp. NK15101]|uniref:hypothetical protein n=1 Tax=Streptomyces sp. NK15101 TaxID=2873261 RepID=UPI001CECE8D6|nr:hypothetical protein [Streptomyces sp. NK15101]
MTTATTTSTELDVLGALLAFDFIGFAQKSAALDPAGPGYGQAVGAAFGLAARRRFPQGATPQEIGGYVAEFLGSLEAGAEDFDPAALERLIADGLGAEPAAGGEQSDPEGAMQARLVLTLRWVRELGLDPAGQRELLAEAERLLTA